MNSAPGLDLSAVVHARVSPKGVLDNLSQQEVDKLLDRGQGGLYPLFRRCALAVLNSGTLIDDARLIFEAYKDFELRIVREPWGIKLEMHHAPGSAFVDGEMIRGVKEHLFAVLRDIVYTHNEIVARFDLNDAASVTNAIFCILRNARALEYKGRPDLVVCWGGHSIPREEYDYTKKVGYELGLRGLSVCTGCGPGAMKGPMKGATIGHSKQRIKDGRYIGVTEPGIIAAEPPNPIVNQLVIMPDIEKRLEAFVRLCHGIIVFPGGAGTAEEILYLLGILLDPANANQQLPLVFTGPRESAGYFRATRPLHRPYARRPGAAALPDHRRRPARSGARDAARLRRRAPVTAASGRRLQFQLAPENPARVPTAVRSESRFDGGARTFDGPAGSRARREPAPRVLRHRRRQREGAGHQADRRTRSVRDPRGAADRKTARRAAARIRRGEAHETGRRVPPELPHRLIAQGRGYPPRDL